MERCGKAFGFLPKYDRKQFVVELASVKVGLSVCQVEQISSPIPLREECIKYVIILHPSIHLGSPGNKKVI